MSITSMQDFHNNVRSSKMQPLFGEKQTAPADEVPVVAALKDKLPQNEPPSSNNGSVSPSMCGGTFFKPHLYLLQQMAPKPACVPPIRNGAKDCETDLPAQYPANYYHGTITRQAADSLLESAGEGGFLVRKSSRDPGGGAYTLCIRFDGQTKNYKLYYDGAQHYVGNKKFDSVEDMVADGLIVMYLEKYADEYINRMNEEVIYDQTPYSQYKRTFTRISTGASVSSSASTSCKPLPCHSSSITLKSHRFKQHTFKGPHWCDYCGNFMWGLVQQGVKCEDCGFGAHRKCEEKVPQDCKPDMKYVRRIFGVDLTTLTMARRNPVPDVVINCIQEIELRGMDSEGLYRVSGSHDEIEKLRAQLDAEGRADLSREKLDDINSVAGLLKLFLRSLPQPLITDCVHAELLEAVRRRYDEDKLTCTQRALLQLPEAHRATLRILLFHLRRVARNSSRNKMDAENLARVFTPTLMGRPAVASLAATGFRAVSTLQYVTAMACPQAAVFNRSPDSSLLMPQQQDHIIVQFLISHAQKIFQEHCR